MLRDLKACAESHKVLWNIPKSVLIAALFIITGASKLKYINAIKRADSLKCQREAIEGKHQRMENVRPKKPNRMQCL